VLFRSISELSTRAGTPVASIKYYLREGMLSPGAKSSANQADYTDAHVARLRLIRALLDVGGLSVASARRVLRAIDDESLPFGIAASVAASALPAAVRAVEPVSGAESGPGSEMVADAVAVRDWIVDRGNPGWAAAARVLDDYVALGRVDLTATLPVYAEAAERIAEADLRTVAAATDRAAATSTVVIGTVLGDALLAGLRRLAHENFSRRMFPVPGDPGVARLAAAPEPPTASEPSTASDPTEE
jgi:DNA-binding transcriptional MerR regulator